MRKLSFLLVFLMLAAAVLGQAYPPVPIATYIGHGDNWYLQNTNIYFNSFNLGGTTGLNGYWIWNGIRLDNPADLAVAVSNSVDPTNFLYKVDYEADQSATTNLIESNTVNIASNSFLIAANSSNIMAEAQFRVLADLSISNFLGYVPTNLIIRYVDSTNNFMVWSNSLNNWYLDVCITNGASGGWGGTNIINVTNYFSAGDTYNTNIMYLTNLNVNNVSNKFELGNLNTYITNVVQTYQSFPTYIFTNYNQVIAGTTYVTNFISNDVSIVAGTTYITNYVTNYFAPSNNIIAGTTYITNFITNNVSITAGETYITNNVTNTITLSPAYSLMFSPSNTVNTYTTNIVTNSIVVTNNITNTFSSTITNNFAPTTDVVVTNINNITNTVSVGDTTVMLTNTFNTLVSNNVTVAGVIVTNIITNTVNNTVNITNVTEVLATNIFEGANTTGMVKSTVADATSFLRGDGNWLNIPTVYGISNLTVTNMVQYQSTNVNGQVLGVYDDTDVEIVNTFYCTEASSNYFEFESWLGGVTTLTVDAVNTNGYLNAELHHRVRTNGACMVIGGSNYWINFINSTNVGFVPSIATGGVYVVEDVRAVELKTSLAGGRFDGVNGPFDLLEYSGNRNWQNISTHDGVTIYAVVYDGSIYKSVGQLFNPVFNVPYTVIINQSTNINYSMLDTVISENRSFIYYSLQTATNEWSIYDLSILPYSWVVIAAATNGVDWKFRDTNNVMVLSGTNEFATISMAIESNTLNRQRAFVYSNPLTYNTFNDGPVRFSATFYNQQTNAPDLNAITTKTTVRPDGYKQVTSEYDVYIDETTHTNSTVIKTSEGTSDNVLIEYIYPVE